MSAFRCGDVVRHCPSGEEWLVAYADGDDVSPTGWPDCIAKASDCDLVRAATDEEHRAHVVEWLGCENECRRQRHVRRLYGSA